MLHTRATDLCMKLTQSQVKSLHKDSSFSVPSNHSFRFDTAHFSSRYMHITFLQFPIIIVLGSILHTSTVDLCTKILFDSQQSQFQVPTTEPFVGIGANPRFNATKTHQKNPNYHPFRQHLWRRWSLTRGRGRGGCRTQVYATLAETQICDYNT